ncbi:hypothetical protein DFH09DRAFT_983916 [Mycena vulgaris]|nr:hypothetical protein DFH09DRAFT_983916 [Mycena vulgaris]
MFPRISNTQMFTRTQRKSYVRDSMKLTPAQEPTLSTQTMITFAQTGHSLVNAKSSCELCMAFSHGLLGWLSLYQAGFLHRDIGIATVLLTTRESMSTPFDVGGDILTAVWPPLSDSASLAATLNAMKIGDDSQSLAQIALKIKEIAAKLNDKVGTECTAFVTDGDMAAEWTTYFDDEHNLHTRSGTEQFMSLPLQQAMTLGTPYLQSPIDDIESFFWLACWAVLFNRHTPTQDRSPFEIRWQRRLANGDYDSRSGVVHGISSDVGAGKYSPVTKQLRPLLKEWWRLQDDLRADWQTVIAAVDDVPTHQEAQYYLHYFHLYALRGVKDGLTVLTKYRDALQDFAPFPSKQLEPAAEALGRG